MCKWCILFIMVLEIIFDLIFLIRLIFGVVCKKSISVVFSVFIILNKIKRVNLIDKIGLSMGYLININMIDIINIVI